MLLGAGRATKEDVIDEAVGVKVLKKIGDKVTKGDILAKIYTNGKGTKAAIDWILDAYVWSSDEVKPNNIILKVIRGK